jgi:hypothetical protein
MVICMEIVKDELLSKYNSEHDTMEYECGAVMYRGINVEDHLVTLDNGWVSHIGKKHGEVPTIDDFLDNIYNNYISGRVDQ